MIQTILKKIPWPKRTNNQIDDKTRIVHRGREDYLYMEGERRMMLFADMEFTNDPADGFQRSIDASSISEWLPPHENEEVTPQDKARILKNFCQYFEQNGTEYGIY